MDLKEFRKKYSENDNIFWTLQSGEMQNLLDEAIEIIEKYESIPLDEPIKLTEVYICKIMVLGFPFATLNKQKADDWVSEDEGIRYYNIIKIKDL